MVMHYQASHTAEVICFAGLVFGPVIRSKVHSRVNTGSSLPGSHHQTTLFFSQDLLTKSCSGGGFGAPHPNSTTQVG